MKKLIYLSILTIILSACGAAKNAGENGSENKKTSAIQPVQNEVSEQAPEVSIDDMQEIPEDPNKFKRANEGKEVFASLEHTPCYGTCPIDKLMILKSGRAVYEGIDHVEHIGKFETNFSKSEMDIILLKAEEIGFWKMADKYDSPVTDFPTTITSLRKGNKTKVIHNRVNGPADLSAFEKLINGMLKEKKLERIVEK
jgi:hypothetical protein